MHPEIHLQCMNTFRVHPLIHEIICSLLCNFNCYCSLGASLMLALFAIDVSLHYYYYYMQNFHRKKKKISEFHPLLAEYAI